jgi:hypothetical protein
LTLMVTALAMSETSGNKHRAPAKPARIWAAT